MLGRTVQHGLRIHLKHPLLTATVIVTLALGVGASGAVFNVMNSVLLRPLTYPEPDRLVRIYHTSDRLKSSDHAGLRQLWNQLPVAYLNAAEWRSESRRLAGIGLYVEYRATFQGGEEPEELQIAGIDTELLAVLGVNPLLGRVFDRVEVERQEPVALLSYSLWQKVFGGNLEVLGRRLLLNGEPYSIVGVMPAGFQIPAARRHGLWTPIRLADEDRHVRDYWNLDAIGRMAAGVTISEARQELAYLADGQAESYPDTNKGIGVRLGPLLEEVVGDSRQTLGLFMAAVLVLLAVACANVAHLMLTQVSSRRTELAIRLALGATRGHLTAQLFVESLILALAGGSLGLLATFQTQDLLLAWIPADLPRADEVSIDGRVFAFTLAVSAGAALLCGVLPVFTRSVTAMQNLGAGRSQTPQRGGGLFLHNGLAVAEVALGLILTVAAGLLLNSFVRLSTIEPGFRTQGLLLQDVRLPLWSYSDGNRRREFGHRFLEQLESLPGVRAAALTSKLPVGGPSLIARFSVPGTGDSAEGRVAGMRFVTPAYFGVLRITLQRGRGFTSTDQGESGRVLVINETMATTAWGREDPVGRTLFLGGEEESYTVVGVVNDVRHNGVGKDTDPLLYQPWSQQPETPLVGVMTAVLAVEGEPIDHAADVRQVARSLDPTLPLPPATTMDRLMAEALDGPRSRTSLLTVVAVVCLGLALLGTYAVLSFAVGRWVPELGVRMAMGADAGCVFRLVLRRSLRLVFLGVALGGVGALFGSRLLQGLLFGVEASDPLTFAGATALLALAGLGAGFFPALKASRIDPLLALRNE